MCKTIIILTMDPSLLPKTGNRNFDACLRTHYKHCAREADVTVSNSLR